MFTFSCTKERNEEVPFRMAIGNGELMHEKKENKKKLFKLKAFDITMSTYIS